MAAENTSASNAGITAWGFDLYTPTEVVGTGDPDAKHEALQAGLNGYLASANKSLMKFWVTIIVDDRFGVSYPASNPYKYFTATTPSMSSYVCNLFNDAQYLKIDGKPVLGLFTSGGAGPAMTLAQLDSFLSCVTDHTGAWTIQMSCSSTDATTFHTNAKFCYGTQNFVGQSGHELWTKIETADQNQWNSGLSGFSRISQITPTNDGRPLDTGITTRAFMDQPTQPQWVKHVADAFAVGGTRMGLTFWDELGEEGAAVAPTVQEATRYIDGIKWVRVGPPATTYTYELNLYSLAAGGTGFSTYIDPYSGNAVGAHDNDEISSATTNDFKSITHPSMTGCGLYARTGPDQGIAEANVDGVDVAAVDLFSASTVHHVNVWNSSALSDQTHTCKWTVTGTKNASSTGVTVTLDSAKITYNPSGFDAANDNAWPALYALPPSRERRRRRRRTLLAA